MIYVTHDQVEAMTLADRIVVLRDGQHRAGRHAARALRRPGQPVRRRLHRLAADELLPADAATADSTGLRLCLSKKRAGPSSTLPPFSGVAGGDRLTLGASDQSISTTPGSGDCDLIVDVDVIEHLGSTCFVYGLTKGEQLIIERPGLSWTWRALGRAPSRGPNLPFQRRRRAPATCTQSLSVGRSACSLSVSRPPAPAPAQVFAEPHASRLFADARSAAAVCSGRLMPGYPINDSAAVSPARYGLPLMLPPGSSRHK